MRLARGVGSLAIAAMMAAGCAAGVHASDAAAPPGRPEVPLAYVRRLVVLPAGSMFHDAPAAAARPSDRTAASRAASARRARARQAFGKLRAECVSALDSALPEHLGRLAGLGVTGYGGHDMDVWPRPPTSRAPAGVVPAGRQDGPDTAVGRRVCAATAADAALVVAADRFQTHAGGVRQVWLRGFAYLVRAGGQTVGPLWFSGRAQALPRLFMGGYQKCDQRLVREAASSAAAQLARTLRTGEQPPFPMDATIVVVPADVPASGTLDAGASALSAVPLKALARERDVLLQPDVDPCWEEIDRQGAAAALSAEGLEPRDLWDPNGRPDLQRLAALGLRLGVQYVFASRVAYADIEQTVANIPERPAAPVGMRRRAEAQADAVLVRVHDGRVLWHDTAVGTATDETDFVRHQPRQRTVEQCALDSVRAAYGSLRSSLSDNLQRLER